MRDQIKLRYDGNPEGVLDGDLNDECRDYSSAVIYKKTTGRGTLTGWVKTLDADDPEGPKVITTQTASYVAALTDAGTVVQISNGSGNTFTLPQNSDVAFPIGTTIVVFQTGAGLTTLTAGSGATITKVAATAKTLGQYSRVVCTKRATNTWNINGDLAAS